MNSTDYTHSKPNLSDHKKIFSVDRVTVARALPDGSVKQEQFHSVDTRNYFRGSNYLLLGPEAIIFNGKYLADPLQIEYDRIKPRRFISFKPLRRESTSCESILLAGKNFSSEGHFVYQHLPRLLTIMRENPTMDYTDWTVLVNPSHQSDTIKWLDQYDLPKFRVQEISPRLQSFSGIYCSMPRSYTDSLSSVDLSYWGKSENTTRSILDSPVFIRRGTKAKRRILNEDQVIEATMAKAPNLNVVDYSKASFFEIKNIIRSATLIIGPSGMGLSPSIMNRSTSIFVLGNRYSKFNWHTRFSIPAALSSNLAATLNARSENAPYDFHQDFDYPIDLFKLQLTELLRLARSYTVDD